MKVYPAIYESKGGDIYLYKDKFNCYSFSYKNWIASNKESLLDTHETDKNITREYLANTYGRVESKEHAEFIKLLCSVNEIKTEDEWFEGCRYFSIDDDGLFFWNATSDADDYKEITIPMPSTAIKEGDAEVKNKISVNVTNHTNHHVRVNTDKVEKVVSVTIGYGEDESDWIYKWPDINTIQTTGTTREDIKNNGDNLLFAGESQLPKIKVDTEMPEVKAPKNDEWPQVGDEVETEGGCKGVLKLDKPDKDGMVVCDFSGGYGLTCKEDLKKPKTPDEELRAGVVNIIARSNAYWSANKKDMDLCAESYVAGQLMAKYNITKKPKE